MSETTHAKSSRDMFCQYCGGKVHLGFYFTCHVCGTAYCYIHMARHSKAHAPQGTKSQAGPLFAS